MIRLLCLTIVLCLQAPVWALDASRLQGLGDVREHKVSSSILERDFYLFVRLPEGYSENFDTKYPVIYLLDGGTTFPLLAGYYRYLMLGEEVPELIIVGVSYGTDDWQKGNM